MSCIDEVCRLFDSECSDRQDVCGKTGCKVKFHKGRDKESRRSTPLFAGLEQPDTLWLTGCPQAPLKPFSD